MNDEADGTDEDENFGFWSVMLIVGVILFIVFCLVGMDAGVGGI